MKGHRRLERRQKREDRGQRTGQRREDWTEDGTEDLQDSEVFETSEVHLADDCQVVSIQITGGEDRGQRT